jgi:predicted  nucleic acid-binding Zn-ribbon protein
MTQAALHIHAPQPSRAKALRTVCPDCGRKVVMLAFFTEWYGWDKTCTRCGREWKDGERMPLSFCRTARADNIRYAINRWRRFRIRRRRLA